MICHINLSARWIIIVNLFRVLKINLGHISYRDIRYPQIALGVHHLPRFEGLSYHLIDYTFSLEYSPQIVFKSIIHL